MRWYFGATICRTAACWMSCQLHFRCSIQASRVPWRWDIWSPFTAMRATNCWSGRPERFGRARATTRFISCTRSIGGSTGRSVIGAAKSAGCKARSKPCVSDRARVGTWRHCCSKPQEVLRVASRFASGYLDGAASRASQASTHAWTEVYFPEHGWFGCDPTLGEGTSEKHIVCGVSSHPRGVMPVSGSYSGPVSSYLGMDVSVSIRSVD